MNPSFVIRSFALYVWGRGFQIGADATRRGHSRALLYRAGQFARAEAAGRRAWVETPHPRTDRQSAWIGLGRLHQIFCQQTSASDRERGIDLYQIPDQRRAGAALRIALLL